MTALKNKCGEVAAKAVARYYGIKLTERISDDDGASPNKITAALKRHGFATTIRNGITFDGLRPGSIVFFPREDHYAALMDKKPDAVVMEDSEKGNHEIRNADFQKRWERKGVGWAMEVVLKKVKRY